MSHFSVCLARLRKERNLTQEAVGEALALSRQTVSNWEKGSIEPSIGVLAKIAAYFGVTTDFLLGNETYTTQYEGKYRQEGFYWGSTINRLAHEVLRMCQRHVWQKSQKFFSCATFFDGLFCMKG